jgi:hypothetical protein
MAASETIVGQSADRRTAAYEDTTAVLAVNQALGLE